MSKKMSGRLKNQTMDDLFKFLILYSGLTFTEVKLDNKSKEEQDAAIKRNIFENKNSRKAIDMLPILVTIAEE